MAKLNLDNLPADTQPADFDPYREIYAAALAQIHGILNQDGRTQAGRCADIQACVDTAFRQAGWYASRNFLA